SASRAASKGSRSTRVRLRCRSLSDRRESADAISDAVTGGGARFADREATSTLTTSAAVSTSPWQEYTGGQRWVFLGVLFLVATANYFDYFILSILLPPIKEEFKVSDTVLGLLSGL